MALKVYFTKSRVPSKIQNLGCYTSIVGNDKSDTEVTTVIKYLEFLMKFLTCGEMHHGGEGFPFYGSGVLTLETSVYP